MWKVLDIMHILWVDQANYFRGKGLSIYTFLYRAHGFVYDDLLYESSVWMNDVIKFVKCTCIWPRLSKPMSDKQSFQESLAMI